MGLPFAEVIGDPVAQSRSPIIHQRWLNRFAIRADFRATRVSADELPSFIRRRRCDSDWRGCSVTIPHKQRIIEWLTQVDSTARTVGAVNCVVQRRGRLIGFNTDVVGVAASLGKVGLEGERVTVIGAGGAARAIVAYMHSRKVHHITILSRDPAKAKPLRELAPRAEFEFLQIEQSHAVLKGAKAIINASPLGMSGAPQMPISLLKSVAGYAAGTTLFDLVTSPADTCFLRAGRLHGGNVIDGRTMLIAQAREAFRLLFKIAAPSWDAPLYDLLSA